MRIFADQMGRSVKIPDTPKRILSIVPSQTELLFYLGLDASIAGITIFCVHPENKVKGKVKVGGTKTLNFTKIHEIKPDLIIGNMEENEQVMIEELEKTYPVWMSDVNTLDNAFDMITSIGEITNRSEEADKLCEDIKKGMEKLVTALRHPPAETKKVAYFIWLNPYLVAGSNTFINGMLSLCGFQNVFADQERYPEVSPDKI